MKLRTTVAALGLLVAVGATASAETSPTTVPATERVQMALQCVQSGSDPRCVSTNYALSLNPGTSSVGNVLTITAAGLAVAPEPFSFAADPTLAPEYRLIGGSTIKGQVTLRQTGSASTPVAALSTVEVGLSAARVDNRRFVDLGSATITKQLVTSAADAVYAYELVVPQSLDGVAVRALGATVKNTQASAGYGYFDGQGGSYFDLPYYAPAPATTG